MHDVFGLGCLIVFFFNLRSRVSEEEGEALWKEEMKGEYLTTEVRLIFIFLPFHQSITLFHSTKLLERMVEALPPRPLTEEYGLEIQER